MFIIEDQRSIGTLTQRQIVAQWTVGLNSLFDILCSGVYFCYSTQNEVGFPNLRKHKVGHVHALTINLEQLLRERQSSGNSPLTGLCPEILYIGYAGCKLIST